MNTALAAGTALLLFTATANAQDVSAPSSESRIRYKPGWVEATCELMKLDFAEAERRKDQDRTFFDRPYPADVETYVPGPFEYAEHILASVPCYATSTVEVSLPPGFRCRLDRTIFRDPETGNEFKAEGGYYEFVFVYLDPNGETVEEKPRSLKEAWPSVVGSVAVRGKLAGKSYRVWREWMQHSPAEVTGSKESESGSPDEPVLAAAQLPFVTAANASMFVFDLRNDMPIIKELTGGPLKEHTFVPAGCQD